MAKATNLGLILVLSIALSGCGSLAGGLANVAGIPKATQTTIHLTVAESLKASYDALDTVEVLADAAVKADVVLHKGSPLAKRAGADLVKAKGLLDAIYNAYHAGLSSDPSAGISAALALISDASEIVMGQTVSTTPPS